MLLIKSLVRLRRKALLIQGLCALLAWTPLYLCTSVSQVYAANPGSMALKVRIDITPPDAISDLVVQKSTGTEGSLILNWTEPGNDGMVGQAASYSVRFSTTSNINNLTDFNAATVYNSGWIPGTGGSSRVQSVDNLIPGLTYYFAIRAQDAVGNIATWSRTGVNQTNFAAADDEPPAPVTGLSASAGGSQVTLTWSDLTTAQKTIDWDYYRIYRSSYSNFNPQIAVATTPLTNFIDTQQLVINVTYYYRIVGVDKGVTSVPPYYGNALESISWSTVSAMPIAPVPLAPSNLTGTAVSTTSILWQWQVASATQSGFNLYASTGGTLAQLGPNATSYLETNLTLNTSYGIMIRSFNGSGESTSSANQTRYTLSSPPLGLVSSTATTTTISLLWNANNNLMNTPYLIEIASNPVGPYTFTPLTIVTNTLYISTGLAESTTYTYRLSSENGDGVFNPTSIQISTMTTLIPPGQINTLAASMGPVQSSVLLQWVAPGNDGTSGNITGGLYDIRWSTNPINSDSDFSNIPNSSLYRETLATNTVQGSQQGLVVTGLQFSQILYFAMKVQDGVPNNFSVLSNVVSTNSQTDVIPPAAVTNLTATLISTTSAQLAWTAPGDDGTSFNNTFGAYDIRISTLPEVSLPSQVKTVLSPAKISLD